MKIGPTVDISLGLRNNSYTIERVVSGFRLTNKRVDFPRAERELCTTVYTWPILISVCSRSYARFILNRGHAVMGVAANGREGATCMTKDTGSYSSPPGRGALSDFAIRPSVRPSVPSPNNSGAFQGYG